MSTPNVYVYAGMDVSKRKLDFHCQGKRKGSVANTPAGHAEALYWLKRQVPGGDLRALHLICESSGGYEMAFAQALWSQHGQISIIDPKRITHFRKSKGIQIKTDAKDAEVICEFAQVTRPRPQAPLDATSWRLRDLVSHRAALQEHLTQMGHRQEQSHSPRVSDSLARVLKELKVELQAMDKELHALLDEHPVLGPMVQAMVQVQGVGWQTAVTVLAYCPELGTLSRNQVTALAGLAPYNDDSGPRLGARHIRGGRRPLRCCLYMPALTATRCNPLLAEFYQRLKAKGKTFKIAITAVMRKLLVALNSIARKSITNNNLSVPPGGEASPAVEALPAQSAAPCASASVLPPVPPELGVQGGQAPWPPEALRSLTPNSTNTLPPPPKPSKILKNTQKSLAA